MNILITGSGSYVGKNIAQYLSSRHPEWMISRISLRSDDWEKEDFAIYDSIIHVAGLAHQKITKENESDYFLINRDLTVALAKKAKQNGVKHFIFMSSMSVYGDDITQIDNTTPTRPDNAYGLSKLQAEEEIFPLQSDSFFISLLRPPMIYGKGCKGNYNALRKLALSFPVFPLVNNKRSMLYIDNLSEFIRQLLICPRSGVFFPQNAELINTSKWALAIAEANGKKLYLSNFLGFCTKLGKHIPYIKSYCQKAFGDCFYLPSLSSYEGIDYQKISFLESVALTEQ